MPQPHPPIISLPSLSESVGGATELAPRRFAPCGYHRAAARPRQARFDAEHNRPFGAVAIRRMTLIGAIESGYIGT